MELFNISFKVNLIDFQLWQNLFLEHYAITGSDNGLSPVCRQSVTWINTAWLMVDQAHGNKLWEYAGTKAFESS